MKRNVVIVVAAAVAASVAAIVAVVVGRARLTPSLQEVVVEVDRPGGTAVNEVELATPLEHALARVDGVRGMRSESTASHVRVTCSFDAPGRGESQLDAIARVRTALDSVRPTLPAGVVPTTTVVRPTRTLWMRTSRSMREQLIAMPGVAAVEACGELGPEHTMVRIDLVRLRARGLDLLDVARTPLTGGLTDGDAVIRQAPGPILVRDVANVVVERRPPACTAVGVDERAIVHVARVSKEREEEVLTALRSTGNEVLTEPDALVVRVAFPAGAIREARERAVAELAREIRARHDVKGLTLEAGLVREDGDAEMVFAATKEAARASVDQLRALVGRRPGQHWAGARGAAQRDVRRIVVTVLGDDLATIEKTAQDVRGRVDGLEGVLEMTRSPSGHVQRPQFDVDRARAAEVGVSQADIRTVLRIALGEDEARTVDRPGVEALAGVWIKDRPMSSLVRVRDGLEPETIIRLNGRRAIELEWEVADAHGVLQRVEKAIAPLPFVTAKLSD